ncbi:MAG: 3-dehydroquinate synthase [Peptoniphilaceae bacterium]|nr:3-dehydroquinate synthase [Peptoniphilaceae bacterium]MDD7383642.1 3-dehydroquinate synthase [Peptoniphilaceae bacterium]MDY3737813.1 3-dehydroquinate synthase [Peptoniphilaceae bacterium]
MDISVNCSDPYSVHLNKGILNEIYKYINKDKKFFIITDENVAEIYLDDFEKIFENQKIKYHSMILPAGENTKSIFWYERIVNELAKNLFDRNDAIIALGGGVIGDISGFVAGTYRRGIDFYQIPTTLLSAIDSSIGGKNAINIERGKNLVGLFYQPKAVFIDPNVFKSLPDDVFEDGFGEIIKYAMIASPDLFEKIENHRYEISDDMTEIVEECIKIKKYFVENDEKETGIRKKLNFGHTIGHAIERMNKFEKMHGHCISMGMDWITKISTIEGYCDGSTYNRLLNLLQKYNLFILIFENTEDLISEIQNDKKIHNGKIDVIIPIEIGKCEIKTFELKEFSNMIRKI